MASCRVDWKRSAEKDLRRVDRRYILRILNAAERLARTPVPPSSRRLHGAERSYRLRVGDYRVIYEYDSATATVTIFHVRHRREAYR